MVPLESSKLFQGLDAEDLKALRQVAREQKFSTGQEVFKEGNGGDGLFVVGEGAAQISAIVGSGVRCKFSEVGPGDFFGEMAVVEDKPRSATVTALKDTVVYFIPREAILGMLQRSPHLSLRLLREISNRLREFNLHYVREVLQYERLALVGRFARSIVHDLKNPLNIIGLAAELAGRENAGTESRRSVQSMISKQVDRISDMVNELLEFTQGSQAAFVLGTTAYDRFVQMLVEETSAEVDLKSARIELETPPPHVFLLLNPKRLARVFHNLIQNATDAMPNGGTIRIRFHQTESEMVTEIEDTGSGIAPEVADSLFEAFVTFGKAHGTGLGLSISKKIIEDHRGRIWARNEPGRGAVFGFSLPLPNTHTQETSPARSNP